MELAIALMAFVLLDVAAVMFGKDSRVLGRTAVRSTRGDWSRR